MNRIPNERGTGCSHAAFWVFLLPAWILFRPWEEPRGRFDPLILLKASVMPALLSPSSLPPPGQKPREASTEGEKARLPCHPRRLRPPEVFSIASSSSTTPSSLSLRLVTHPEPQSELSRPHTSLPPTHRVYYLFSTTSLSILVPVSSSQCGFRQSGLSPSGLPRCG